MTSNQITIALTKGRIEKDTVKLLEKAGFDMSFMADKGRNLIFESPDKRFRFLLVKAPDVTTYVRHGVADIGIVGKDVLVEHPTGYLEMLDLNFGLCKFSVASTEDYNPYDHKRKRIATKYPTIATDYFNQKGEDVEIISIARAVVKRPDLYIFDDSFSALDYKTDATLRRRLKEVTQDATVLIVAQRVGTIMDADQIIVLDKGEIVGRGRHEELMESNEIYREIANSQLNQKSLTED